MTKKIIISTFNNSDNNYGAVFQSFALGKFLEELSYDVSFLTLKHRGNSKVSFAIKVKKYIKRLLYIPIKRKIERRKVEFSRFVKESQKQIIYDNIEMLHKNPPNADVFISGSDQVWNPVLINDDLFLDYAADDCKKISYAASMGNECIPLNNEEKFAKYIARYDAISVREDTMVDIIEKYTTKKVYHNVDPVFLVNKKKWTLLEKKYEALKFKKYILIYVIEWTNEFDSYLKKIKKETNLPVVFVSMGNIKKTCADQVIYDASPNEFLYLLRMSEMIVTTSFHGTALAIVLNKKFISLVGKDKPTRIESVLRHFSLEDRKTLNNYNAEIDFERINSIILKDQSYAKEYLTNALN